MMTTGEEEEEKEDRMGGGVGSHSIARRRRLPPSPLRDVMPPSTYASYSVRHFDRRAHTTIRAPPPSPAATTTTIAMKTSNHNGKIGRIDECMLHLDATYEKQYGDAYFDVAV